MIKEIGSVFVRRVSFFPDQGSDRVDLVRILRTAAAGQQQIETTFSRRGAVGCQSNFDRALSTGCCDQEITCTLRRRGCRLCCGERTSSYKLKSAQTKVSQSGIHH